LRRKRRKGRALAVDDLIRKEVLSLSLKKRGIIFGREGAWWVIEREAPFYRKTTTRKKGKGGDEEKDQVFSWEK